MQLKELLDLESPGDGLYDFIPDIDDISPEKFNDTFDQPTLDELLRLWEYAFIGEVDELVDNYYNKLTGYDYDAAEQAIRQLNDEMYNLDPGIVADTIKLVGATMSNREYLQKNPGSTPKRPFPMSALPPTIREYTRLICDKYDVNYEVYALSLLTGLAAVLGTQGVISDQQACEQDYIALWSFIVAEPGCGKSPTIKEATAAHNLIQSELSARHKKTIQAILDKSAECKHSPTPLELVASDVTLEALARLNEKNTRGLFYVNTEGAGLFNSMNEYKKAGSDHQRLLKFFDGDPVTIDRKSGSIADQHMRIEHALISVLCATTPEQLRENQRAMKSASGSGLWARFWLVQQDKPPRKWQPSDAAALERCRKHYQARITDIFHSSMVRRVLVDPSAVTLLEIEVSSKIANTKHTDLTRHFWAKSKQKILRLAAVMAIAENSVSITNDIMSRAIALGKWFTYESLRILGGIIGNDDEKAGIDTRVLNAIKRKTNNGKIPCKIRDLQQIFTRLDRAKIVEVCKGLAEDGIIQLDGVTVTLIDKEE